MQSVTAASSENFGDFANAAYQILHDGGHTTVDKRISLAALGCKLAHLPRHRHFRLGQCLSAFPNRFQILELRNPGKATVYAISPSETNIESECCGFWSICRIFHTRHRRSLQLVPAGAGRAFLLRRDGEQLRHVSVVTADTQVKRDGKRILIECLQPELAYCLEGDDDGDKVDRWVTGVQKAIEGMRKDACQCSNLLQSDVQLKNALSLTWHRRSIELVAAGSRLFILRSLGARLRGVSMLTPGTKITRENLQELRIASLEPSQSYYVRFGDKECEVDSRERAEWLEMLRPDGDENSKEC